MAKVTLRLYNREIESLIDHGQVEEAIAHCKYILQSYPKHIETYRLLAKAFLESQRYGEASDIFQRVLSAVPDDFVSQVGMSIIREDEGNLDGAIWHMERAFEVQPSNTAVQDELRRLYQRRDGVELTRIRLTRGALARMYAKGDLYQQAIAEIHATLVTEPVRPDLQVLLARMCYQAGQRIESTEICSELLSKHPYCFEANRILSQILPNTTRAEDAKIYLQRIFALDPYSAFLTPSILASKDVQDNAVMIERLEFKPGSKTEIEQPEWASSLGLILSDGEPSTEPMPEWLTGIEKPPTPVEAEKAEPQEVNPPSVVPVESKEALIPDWMKSAGWVEAVEGTTEASIEQPVFTEEPEEGVPSVEGEVAPADIPQWLQEMAPSSQAAEKEMEKTSAPDWIGEEGIPDWLREIQPAQETPETTKESLIPESAAPTSMDKLPDWLKAMEVASPIEQQPVPEPVPQETHPEPLLELPQWLQELKTLAPSEGAVGSEPSPKAEELPLAPETAVSRPTGIGDLPDWLSALPAESGTEEIAPSEAFPAIEPGTQPLEEAPETPAQPAIEIPEWLQELGKEQSTTISALGEELPASAGPQPPAEVIPSMEDQDAALAWLEGLAAKHGAEEETLYVKPEDRIETPPTWVQQASQEMAGQPAVTEETTPEIQTPVSTETVEVSAEASAIAPEVNETPQPAAALPPSPALEEYQQPPEVVSPVIPESIPPAETQPVEMPAAPVQSVDETEAALAWLESLAAKQGAEEETLFVKPEDRTEVPPEWVQKASAVQVEETVLPPEAPVPPFEEVSRPPEEIVQPVEQIPTAPVIQETPAPLVSPVGELPQWLQELEMGHEISGEAPQEVETAAAMPVQTDLTGEKILSAQPEEKLPEWLQGFEEPLPAEPAMPGEISRAWLEGMNEPAPEALQPVPIETSPESLEEMVPSQTTAAPAQVEEAAQEPVEFPKLLQESQAAFIDGKVDIALQGYSQLVNKGLFIDETIHDLRDALYRFPVDISIWQVLGDAYVRSNRLQDALDAFTKAEELLR